MATLLDLFSPSATDTPLFGPDDEDEVADLDADEPETEDGSERPPTPSRDPYPVVLGPVRPAPPPAGRDPFATIDLDALRLRRSSPAPEPPAEEPQTPPRPSGGDVSVPRPVLPGDTPLLRAAEATLSYHLALFDARAGRFMLTRAPSDARRLLVAAHGLRLAVETFEPALPSEAARRLVAALRPLVSDLDTAVQAAQAAAASGRPDLARRARAAVALAGDRLRDGGHQAWGGRADRLVGRLVAQAEAGALRSDDAPLVDDYVGPPGSAPTATRLRHVLGGAVWSRFEALRAFEDDLAAPTDELAAHLAVALSGLHFVLALASEAAGGPLREVAAVLESAEREVVQARRQRLEAGGDGPVPGLAEVWDEVTSEGFRQRLAALVATV